MLIEKENNLELRLRREKVEDWINYYRTQKSGEWLSRKEKEDDISQEEFDKHWNNTEWKRLKKTRYIIPYEWKSIELDLYREKLSGLMIAEVEFKTEQEQSLNLKLTSLQEMLFCEFMEIWIK